MASARAGERDTGWGGGRRKPFDGRRDVRDEPREPGAEGREEPDKPEAGDAPEERPRKSVTIIQQNAVIVNGRFVRPEGRTGGWI